MFGKNKSKYEPHVHKLFAKRFREQAKLLRVYKDMDDGKAIELAVELALRERGLANVSTADKLDLLADLID